MKYRIEKSPLSQIQSDALVVLAFQDEELAEFLKSADSDKKAAEFYQKVVNAAADENFAGKVGQTLSLPTYGELASKRIFLAGLGKRASCDTTVIRKLAANMARRLLANDKNKTVSFFVRADDETAANKLQALVEGWTLGGFTFMKYKSAKDDKRAEIQEISIAGWNGDDDGFNAACKLGETIGNATNFARGLIAEPACFMTPTRLSEEAQRIAASHKLECRIIDADEAREMGMGSFLGVARGAKEPCKFMALKYDAPGAKRTVAVVGKGITFDSGGLSLKPAQSMEHMKYDMSGAAAVLGIMDVIGTMRPGVSVLGIIASTENMPGDNALHPGDVLTAMNGKTIEVNNTDAEGRLVLADALTYACKQGADELIDIATLTGAIVTALGRVAAGVMGTDQQLLERLMRSAGEAGEKLWQMPLFDEYKESLKSDVADLKNAGSRGEAGSSSAGMFLREFVEAKPWAHLDIAGPGWMDKDKDETNKGGTAFGVRTLCYYLLNHAATNGKS